MKQTFDFLLDSIRPTREEVFQSQGIAENINPGPKVVDLFNQALEIFMQTAAPKGICTDISKDAFADIYEGEGNNEKETPLPGIYPQADYLGLFAFTLGPNISQTIDVLFKDKEYALGAMLDTVASEAAEIAITLAENNYLTYLVGNKDYPTDKTVLLYSPGYCGWHVNGQRKLFAHLTPEEIGIFLNDSCLMVPLKSVSGVLLAGDHNIHIFNNSYPFCAECKNRTCRQRIQMVKNKTLEA
jgi:hypothetical protein